MKLLTYAALLLAGVALLGYTGSRTDRVQMRDDTQTVDFTTLDAAGQAKALNEIRTRLLQQTPAPEADARYGTDRIETTEANAMLDAYERLMRLPIAVEGQNRTYRNVTLADVVHANLCQTPECRQLAQRDAQHRLRVFPSYNVDVAQLQNVLLAQQPQSMTIYPALNRQGNVTMVLVGLDAHEHHITHDKQGSSAIIDFHDPCPPPLNCHNIVETLN